jgi:hypothetical protein
MGHGKKRHAKSKLKGFETRTDTDNWITDFEMSRRQSCWKMKIKSGHD